MLADRVLRELLHSRRRVRRQTGQKRDRLLIAAIADHRDGVQLLNLGSIVLVENDRSTRALRARV